MDTLVWSGATSSPLARLHALILNDQPRASTLLICPCSADWTSQNTMNYKIEAKG